MNEDIMRKFGFGTEVEDVSRGVCPFCKKQVKAEDFRDPLSVKEYNISGLCQFCQDDFFGR